MTPAHKPLLGLPCYTSSALELSIDIHYQQSSGTLTLPLKRNAIPVNTGTFIDLFESVKYGTDDMM